MKRWTLLLVGVGVACGLVVPILAAGLSETDRPFKAVLTGSAHWEWPGTWSSDCGMVTTVTEATGQATHLGRVAMTSSHCPAEPDHVLDGWMTITAANGDTLIGRYDYDPASTVLAFPIAWAGGTGRFAQASGSVAGSFTVTPQFIPGCIPDPDPMACLDYSVPWPWAATISGTISY